MMGKNSLSWLECTDSKVGLKNTFGGNVPSLDKLDLAQCVIGETCNVKISLNFAGLPEGSPIRWRTNGCDRMQFRMDFYGLHEFKIVGKMNCFDLEVSAAFNSSNTFEIFNNQFRLELTYKHVNVEVYPYNSQIFEEPRAWFHQ